MYFVLWEPENHVPSQESSWSLTSVQQIEGKTCTPKQVCHVGRLIGGTFERQKREEEGENLGKVS